jgi:hypothetical protein
MTKKTRHCSGCGKRTTDPPKGYRRYCSDKCKPTDREASVRPSRRHHGTALRGARTELGNSRA